MLTYNQGGQQYGGYSSQPVYPQLPSSQPYPSTPWGGSGQVVPAPAPQQQQTQHFYNPFHHPVPPAPGTVQAPAPFGSGSSQQASAWSGRPGYSYATVTASQLQPQQLETVDKDEDPIYGPLGRARGKIERAFTSDNEVSPDLADMLGSTNEPPYIPAPSQTTAFRNVRVTRTTPLPDALHQELNYKDQTAQMGLFEEIGRAWFTVDNRLFLWDYTDGREFSRYDQQPDTIQAVGLVRARKDVFIDDITHLLVICTASKATLLGLSRSKEGELSLYATNMSVDMPAGMQEVRGTDAGRIFMLGSNKDLYELEYSTSSGWLGGGSKVWLSNRSSGYLSTWVPTVFQAKAKEGVESIVVDQQQGRLFALYSRGEVEWFDVSGSRFESRAKYTNLRNDFVRFGHGGPAPKYPGARVATIAVVGGDESRKAWVVAISASGARIYLGTGSYSAFYPGAMGGSLQVIGHRPPPPETAQVLPQSFYSSGTFLAVHNSAGPSQPCKITVVTEAVGRQSAMRENFENFQAPVLQEWACVENIPSQVWTIAEVRATDPSRLPNGLRRDDGLALFELARQSSVGARHFLVLTTSGIFWVQQPRPVDMLEADLEVEKEAAVHATRAAFGRIQLAAMAIQMGSKGQLRSLADLTSASINILLAAEPPVLRSASTGARSIVYSPRHDALALSIARFLRPIWNAKVINQAAPPIHFKINIAPLEEVTRNLMEVKTYIDNHPFPRHQAEGEAKLAWDQEELSVHGLCVLLNHAIEAIAFITLLNDYKLNDVIPRCDQATQSTLMGLTYQALLTSQGGREVARKLVTALIELHITQEMGIDSLSSALQQRCGTFVQPGDVVLYKAEESLRRAENTRDAHERSESIAESLRLFSRASSSATTAVFQRLPDAAKRYRVLQDVRGTIELPLRVALELDKEDKAGDYVRDGRNPGDPRVAFLEQRQECYQLVVEALGGYDEQLNKAVAGGSSAQAIRVRDEAYALALASDDELFHFYLYDWMSALGRSDQLLDMETPFIEPYLQMTTSNVPGRRDLLWKYYSRREEYLLAAKALSDLATRPGELSLHERVYYLAQALTNAKSAATIGSEDVEFTTGLQERIDVAQVQLEVVHAVEGHPDMSPAEKLQPLQQLNSELLSLDDLYQNYARPLRLYESILLILKTADMRVEDVCQAVWEQMLQSRATEVPIDAAVGELITDLCKKYYPSEGAPADIVLPLVYTWAAPHTGEAGWVTSAFLSGGVGLRELWDVVYALHDEAADDREFYADEAAAVISRWMTERDGLPPAEVEQFASNYLLRTNGQTLDARRAATRKTMQAAKAAAQRF